MNKKWNFNWEEKKTEIKEKNEKKQSFGDSRFWKLKLNDKKEGQALIRFLPDRDQDLFVKFYSHSFMFKDIKGKDIYYNHKCATTIPEGKCPICVKNRDLYNSPHKADKEAWGKRKRKTHYVSNILVIKDPAAPENEGKVFLLDYGQQIYDLYSQKFFGTTIKENGKDVIQSDNEVIFCPSDFYQGADFIIRSTKEPSDAFNSYRKSTFNKQNPIFKELSESEREEAINKLMEQVYDLSEWENPDLYPTAKQVLDKVGFLLGEESEESARPSPKSEPVKAKKSEPAPVKEESDFDDKEDSKLSEESFDDDEAFLASLKD